jgi:uncharacterized phage infection (PIP) family protein YhgE
MKTTDTGSSTTALGTDARSQAELTLTSRLPNGADAPAIQATLRRLAAAGSLRAAQVEQVQGSVSAAAVCGEKTAALVSRLANGQHQIDTLARSVQKSVEEGSTSLQQVASGAESVSKAAREVAESSENMAATVEQAVRSVRGVSGNARDLSAAAEELLATSSEMAAGLASLSAR